MERFNSRVALLVAFTKIPLIQCFIASAFIPDFWI